MYVYVRASVRACITAIFGYGLSGGQRQPEVFFDLLKSISEPLLS